MVHLIEEMLGNLHVSASYDLQSKRRKNIRYARDSKINSAGMGFPQCEDELCCEMVGHCVSESRGEM